MYGEERFYSTARKRSLLGSLSKAFQHDAFEAPGQAHPQGHPDVRGAELEASGSVPVSQTGTTVSPAGQGSVCLHPGTMRFGPRSMVKGCQGTRAKSHFCKEKNDLEGHSQMLTRAVAGVGAHRERGPFSSPCVADALE